jgi:PAS domain S-box-containing protein
MRILRDVPLKRKLTIISMVTSGVALLLACGVIAASELAKARNAMLTETLTLAQMIGDNSAAALTFGDPDSAEQTLRSLGADGHIVGAVIYDLEGQPFARYQPTGAVPFTPPPVQRNFHRFTDDSLEIFGDGFAGDYVEVFRDITVSGEPIGTVYMRHGMIELRESLKQSGYLILGVIAMASLVAWGLTRRFVPLVAGPIMDLGDVVRGVAINKDFSVRAVKQGEDEVGRLIDGFNEMLGEIQHRDSALQAARNELEKRVEERTEELATSLGVLNATLESTADGIVAANLHGKVVCYNSKFAALWGMPPDMLERADSSEMVDFIAAQVTDPEHFIERVQELYASGGEETFDVIELKDGRTYERYIQPQRVGGESVGMVANFRDVTERKRAETELQDAARHLMEVSRQAGMAEVATSVLHNVGNVLNSVNVSCSVVASKVSKSRIGSVAKTADLLREHADDPVAFFTTDPRGRKLPDFLAKLAARLAEEQEEVLRELQHLGKNIDHIKEIVAMQQNYAKVSGVTEVIKVTDLIEDSLRMNAGALMRHEVKVIREYADVPWITLEKHKAVQILVNLIRNAKHACDASGTAEKKVTIRVTHDHGRVRVSVTDNGVGIPPENLTRIFAHGFTTKKDGHGFGLHSGALAAREMGGSLTVHSNGVGCGATFTLELPSKSPTELTPTS